MFLKFVIVIPSSVGATLRAGAMPLLRSLGLVNGGFYKHVAPMALGWASPEGTIDGAMGKRGWNGSSAVPAGLEWRRTKPGVETPGYYCHLYLRDGGFDYLA